MRHREWVTADRYLAARAVAIRCWGPDAERDIIEFCISDPEDWSWNQMRFEQDPLFYGATHILNNLFILGARAFAPFTVG